MAKFNISNQTKSLVDIFTKGLMMFAVFAEENICKTFGLTTRCWKVSGGLMLFGYCPSFELQTILIHKVF